METYSSFLDTLKFSVIVATDITGGIAKTGPDGKANIPWVITEDMTHYKAVTTYNYYGDKNTLIMGRNTYESMPPIAFTDRISIVLTKNSVPQTKGDDKDIRFAKDWESVFAILKTIREIHFHSTFFIIGGLQIYITALEKFIIDQLYWTRVCHDYDCDYKIPMHLLCRAPKPPLVFQSVVNDSERQVTMGITMNNTSDYRNPVDVEYLALLKSILNQKIRTSRNAPTRSMFGTRMEFSLKDTIPLLTSKRVNVEAVVKELIFFIRGETDTSKLEADGVKIWEANTTRKFLDSMGLDYPEKFMGPMYGYQWRNFGAPYTPGMPPSGGVDQLVECINLLKTDPYSRRILMTTYNPAQAKQGVLYPCHGIIVQFFVEDDESLSCQMYQRSADFCVGVPFNMASYGILTHIIATIIGRKAGKLVMVFGDTHVYQQHETRAWVQLARETMGYPKPNIEIKSIDNINDITAQHINVTNYRHHPHIAYVMIP